MALAASPTHPLAVHRVLKNAYRQFAAGATSTTITVTAPPNRTTGQDVTIAGTVAVIGIPMPATVSVALRKVTAVQATRTATVTAATGAFTTTFTAGAASAGTWNAVVTDPLGHTTTSANFTVT